MPGQPSSFEHGARAGDRRLQRRCLRRSGDRDPGQTRIGRGRCRCRDRDPRVAGRTQRPRQRIARQPGVHASVRHAWGTPELHDHFGAALAAGDFNGDGAEDLAIGVPDEDLALSENAGEVDVVYGLAVTGLSTTAGGRAPQRWHQTNISTIEDTGERLGHRRPLWRRLIVLELRPLHAQGSGDRRAVGGCRTSRMPESFRCFTVRRMA